MSPGGAPAGRAASACGAAGSPQAVAVPKEAPRGFGPAASEGLARRGCRSLPLLAARLLAGHATHCPNTLRCPNPNPPADTDVDAVTDHLRRNYKEYQRQKAGPFKNQVARAIEVITRRGGVAKPEIKLQVGCGAGGRRGWVSCVGAESPAMGSPAPRLRCAHVLCSR